MYKRQAFVPVFITLYTAFVLLLVNAVPFFTFLPESLLLSWLLLLLSGTLGVTVGNGFVTSPEEPEPPGTGVGVTTGLAVGAIVAFGVAVTFGVAVGFTVGAAVTEGWYPPPNPPPLLLPPLLPGSDGFCVGCDGFVVPDGVSVGSAVSLSAILLSPALEYSFAISSSVRSLS